MAAPTISDAFANAPSGVDTTNLQNSFQSLWNTIDAATTFTDAVEAELLDELVRLARRVSVNLIKSGKF